MDTHINIPPQQQPINLQQTNPHQHPQIYTVPVKTKPSLLSNAFWCSMKLTEATVVGVTAVAFVTLGIYSCRSLLNETNDYFLQELGQGSGFNSIPFFEEGCVPLCEFLHKTVSYPEQPVKYCHLIGTHQRDQIDPNEVGSIWAAVVPTLAVGAAAITSFSLTTCGLSLLGHTFKVYQEVVFGTYI